MSNAEEEVKAFADYITSSNNDDGIAAALNHFRNLITD
jgi:hydroxymethylpyrimidine pyrophosphatase-like HAD family hydrolase